MSNQYPTLQILLDKQTKEDFFELAQVRGTTPSAILKSFIQTEIASLGRERRIATKPVEDFLD